MRLYLELVTFADLVESYHALSHKGLQGARCPELHSALRSVDITCNTMSEFHRSRAHILAVWELGKFEPLTPCLQSHCWAV